MTYEKKYKSLKDDFKHLLTQFQQSELLRREQNELIEGLRLQMQKQKKITRALERQVEDKQHMQAIMSGANAS